ncbi:hypothetical protein C4K68_07815 [Pokkaliibacter plantistimulans]|uniref:Uncharacterized protein n=1 Tax=Proteobacteria bacterium 228 TaxID=2083153 RepID=A0A2S5KSX7_9PROT|nr:hypothetical protein [Pokkaliibacter plantistimulans]PPC77944.1 hypothetical protein C4K68_07815 [Pokkaliibacter plantistimulans]
MIRIHPALRAARAQQILDRLDAAATPGAFDLYSGGQPDPDGEIASLSDHSTETAYTVGVYVRAGLHYYRADTAGVSGSTAPDWPIDGSTVSDGGVTWTDMGAVPVLLGTLTLSQPCGQVDTTRVGAAYVVSTTFFAWTEDSAADASQQAAWGRFRDGNGQPALDGSVGVEGSGADFIINTADIVAGGPIRIKAGTTPVLIEPGA